MSPDIFVDLFGDSQEHPYLSSKAFDPKRIKSDFEQKGYSVVHGLLPESRIVSIRDFWLKTFSSQVPAGRVTWAPYLGQENHIGFSHDAFQGLFRACDFLWNKPIHAETREVGIRLNALRNIFLGQPPRRGIDFSPDRYGIFMTASYYPAGTGFMEPHRDGVASSEMLIHCLAPITFKGIDYAEGGMTITDKNGVTVDVEATLVPGDVVFYDGSLMHGVAPIVPLKGKTIGRLQISPLPTILHDLKSNPRALNAIPLATVIAAKLKCLKNAIRIKLGLRPGLR